MRPLSLSWLRGALLLASLIVLGSCTVVVDESAPRPLPEDRFCTREYNPVCARRGGDRQTFSNACLAESAGYRIVHGGQCRREGGERPRVCTREYSPVCAARGNDRRTFPNGCEADVAGYRVIREGECRRRDDEGEPRFCTREYAPVCARRGGRVRTFSNSCEAEAANYRILGSGPCRG